MIKISPEAAGVMPFEDYVLEHPEAAAYLERYHFLKSLPPSEQWKRENQPNNMPGWLGVGLDKAALRLGPAEAGTHVLKIVLNDPLRPFQQQLSPLLKSQSIPRTEQLVAASEKKGVLVTTFAVGVLPAALSAQGLARRINPTGVQALHETLGHMQQQGVLSEIPSNVAVDRDGTFTLYDNIERSGHTTPDNASADYRRVTEGFANYYLGAYNAGDFRFRMSDDANQIMAAFERAKPDEM